MSSLDFADRQYPDVEALQAQAVDFASARERFMEAVRDSPEPSVEKIEIAAAELLQQAVSFSRKHRRGLSALMATYAALWSDAHRPTAFDDLDEPDVMAAFMDDLDVEDDPHTDGMIESLDRLTDKLENLISHFDTITEGRSSNGRVIVHFDNDMRLIDLNLDPPSLSDPEYKASLIEAVNAGIEPVRRRRWGMAEAFLPEPEAPEESPEVADVPDSNDAAMKVFGAVVGADEVQLNLAKLLPQSQDLPVVVERAEVIEDICLTVEEWLDGQFAALDDCRALLAEKARLPDLTPDDLTGFASLEELFVDMELDEYFEVEPIPGLDIGPEVRSMVETVARELRRQDEERKNQRYWQCVARRLDSQLAAVEQQTFEGHSSDGLVTARALGTVHLTELEVMTDRRSKASSIKQSVIEAVNAAIREANHRRTCSMMLEA